MRSGDKHQFSMVPKANIPRSAFDRSCEIKTTLDAGYLVPIFVDEVLPGDSINLKASVFARLATPIKPVMDNLYMDVFFFAVPYRLLWTNWERMNGAQDNPGDSVDYTVPQIVGTNVQNGTLWDYFGLPTNVTGSLSVSALPFRAYNLIWNEWFRSEVLQDSLPKNIGDGPDLIADYVMQRRGKRFDYFTSGLPWPSKGPDVPLPLGDSADVVRVPNAPTWGVALGGGNATGTGALSGDATGNLNAGANGASLDPRGGLVVDLSSATASTINALREAFQLQRLFERDARGGTRYTEILRSHFQVISPDHRLQRPELLHTSSHPVNIHPVAQTSGTAGTGAYTPTAQGNLSGFGTVGFSGSGFYKSFVEHCVIIGLVSVRASMTYQQGIERMWSRKTRWDFFWPALGQIGEQPVLNKEIYAQGTAVDDEVFSYAERYAEYRYKPSKITGKFRSTDPQSLDIWHLGVEFANLPVLNSEFIEENPPVGRIIAVQNEPHFLFDALFSMKCARPMAVYGVPGYIDHF